MSTPEHLLLPDGWSDEEHDALCAGLTLVADSALKVKILQVFLTRNESYLTTQQLADILCISPFEVRDAVQQLSACKALHYVPFFGFSDLCSLLRRFHDPAMSQWIKALARALRECPDVLWIHFQS